MASYTQTDDVEQGVTLLSMTTSPKHDVKKHDSEEEVDEEEEEEALKRHQWSSKREYILSAVGFCVALGNVWRFPYMCNRNGGGAFMVPFMLSLILCGLPLYFLESALGQFTSTSPVQSWTVCPLVKGIGLSMFMISVVVFWYYNTIQAWSLYYLVMSCQTTLPWTRCDGWWNTPRCSDFSSALRNSSAALSNATSDWSSAVNYTANEGNMMSNVTSAASNGTNVGREAILNPVSSVEEFWEHNVLQMTSSMYEPGQLVWYVALGLAGASLFMFLGLIKGIRSSGKVVYVTAIAPYVVLTVFVVRGVTLPGAMGGIVFYLKPTFSRLLDLQVWVEAALQVFYSLGPAWGGIATLASYNKFNNNCLRDSIILSFVCEGTSVYGGFAIFSVLGYMAYESGVPIEKVVSSGPGLAFIAYPEAISRMPLPQLWAVLFFIMIFTLACDSMLMSGETVLTVLSDNFPRTIRRHLVLLTSGETVLTVLSDNFPRTIRRHRVLVTALFCGGSFLLGLPLVTQGGIYIFQLADWFVGALTIISIGFLECVVLGWVYGADRFGDDVQMMIGRKPPMVLKLLWLFFAPVLLLAVFIITMYKYRPPTLGTYHYDVWGNILGWFIAIVSLIPIPVVAVYQLYKAKGTFMQRLRTTLSPEANWGPAGTKERQLYWKEVAQRPPRQHWTDIILR